jgi:hypothetical protein
MRLGSSAPMKQVGGVLLLAASFGTGLFGQAITRSFGSVVFPGGTAATSPNISRNFGSVVFPGGSPTTPAIRSGAPLIAPAAAFNGRPSTGFTGGNSFTGNGNSFRGQPANRGRRTTPATVYAYPVYVGGYGYADPGAPSEPGMYQAQQQQPNVTVVMPPQQEVRPVIIQMGPDGEYTTSREPARTYRRSAPPAEAEQQPAEPEQPHYLLAFKDHTIYSSVAYWFDGDTLHYFTNGNTHNQASIALIDRDLTERLNREMGTDFKMPPAK